MLQLVFRHLYGNAYGARVRPTGSGGHTGYYVCQTKSCDSYAKSIPRAKLEGAFEAFLRRPSPSVELFAVIRAMFKDAWDQRAAQGLQARHELQKQLKDAEKQSEKLLDLIMNVDNPRLISTYESRLNGLESQKCLLAEKLAQSVQPARPFEEALEHAITFLASPWKLWNKGSFDLRRTILKLVLLEPLH